jgi:hypothetical protein
MDSQEVEVRKATPPDVPAIVALNDALFQEDAGQRDPSVNLDWAKQHGAGHFAEMVGGHDRACDRVLPAGRICAAEPHAGTPWPTITWLVGGRQC